MTNEQPSWKASYIIYKDPQGAVDIRWMRPGALPRLSFRIGFKGGFWDLAPARLVSDKFWNSAHHVQSTMPSSLHVIPHCICTGTQQEVRDTVVAILWVKEQAEWREITCSRAPGESVAKLAGQAYSRTHLLKSNLTCWTWGRILFPDTMKIHKKIRAWS